MTIRVPLAGSKRPDPKKPVTAQRNNRHYFFGGADVRDTAIRIAEEIPPGVFLCELSFCGQKESGRPWN
jgi:hypothetical protein